MKYLLIAIISFSFIQASGQDSLLMNHVQDHAMEFIYEGDQWSGPGSEFILEAAEEHHFFLIGEFHGIADVSLFTAELLKKIKDFGYEYYITETGPYSAGLLESYQDDYQANIGAHLKKYPLSFPFFNYQEEAEILKVLSENSLAEGPALWGLDQEFAASYRMFFQWLYDTAATEDSKTMAKKYSDLAQEAFLQSFEQKNPAASIMGRLSPKDFDELDAAFGGQEACLDLIKELRETTTIYQLWFQGGGYESNETRAALMKSHFNRYYSQIPFSTESKVLGKMGANHFYKGRSPLNILDIGNHIHEVAINEGKSSFHLFILPKRGTSNAWNPFTQQESDKTKPFDTLKDGGRIDFNTIINGTPDGHYSVVDLRPIRKLLFDRKLKIENQGLERMVWSYDAMLIMPEVSAATNYNQE